jgi:hypothetical protein
MACIITATSPKRIAEELEELAHEMRNNDCFGYVGNGVGYYASITYASCKRTTKTSRNGTDATNVSCVTKKTREIR